MVPGLAIQPLPRPSSPIFRGSLLDGYLPMVGTAVGLHLC